MDGKLRIFRKIFGNNRSVVILKTPAALGSFDPSQFGISFRVFPEKI